MENKFEQYEMLLGRASEMAEACLDREGGAFFLAWTGELIRDLATAGYFKSACLTVQKLCELTGVDWAWARYDELSPEEKIVYLNLFAGTLMDYMMIVIE